MNESQLSPEEEFKDFVIEDMENFSTRSGKQDTLGEIIRERFTVCLKYCSMERTRQGTVYRIINGERMEMPGINTMEVFRNSVEALEIVLIPSIEKDDIIKKNIDNLKNNLETKKREYWTKLKEINGKKKQSYVMSMSPDSALSDNSNKEVQIQIDYNEACEIFEHETYKEILKELSRLLDKKNWFKEKAWG